MNPRDLQPGDIIGYAHTEWKARVKKHVQGGILLFVYTNTDGYAMNDSVRYDYEDFDDDFKIVESSEPMTPCVNPITQYYLEQKGKPS